MHIRRLSSIALLAAASFVVGGCGPLGAQSGVEAAPARMPDFALKDANGKVFSSEALRGKVVLVDFWATWCVPCKKEMPGFQELQDRYARAGLVVVGIALDSDPRAVARFAAQLGVRYPLLISNTEVVKSWGRLQGLPTTFLVDRSGAVRKKIVGFEYPAEIEKELRPLLEQPESPAI